MSRHPIFSKPLPVLLGLLAVSAIPALAGAGDEAGTVPVYTNADLPQQPHVSIIGGLDIGWPEEFPPPPAAPPAQARRPGRAESAASVIVVPIRERVFGVGGATCVYGRCRVFGGSVFGRLPFGHRRVEPREAPSPHLRDALPPPLGGFVGRPGKHLGRADGKPIVPGRHHPRRRSHR